MRTRIIATALLFICSFTVLIASAQTQTAPIPAEITSAAHSAVTTGCDAELWQHVYHPARLQVVEKSIEVTGTIHHIKRETDGDDHIQLKLDPEFQKLLNDRNKTAQAGSLVIEPVCQGPDTQPDAEAACRDFHSPVDVPTAKGAKVKVMGSFVFDGEPDHGWMEIHPVTQITVIQ